MRSFYNFSQTIINFFWRVLFFLMFFFALTSPNIILGDNPTFGTSTTMLTTSLVIGIVAVAVMNYAYPWFRTWLVKVFVTHQLATGSLLLLIVMIGQVIFVTYVHPVSGFDAGMLHYAATSAKHVQEVGVTSYYSLNQNNMPIMLFMHWLSQLTGQTSWQFFDYVTLFFVDLSAFFNLLSVFVAQPLALGTALYIHAGWLAVFPSIIMPYTDAWGLPLVSFFILCYLIMRQTTWPILLRATAALGFGISVTLTYFMKPSSIIPVIAIVMMEILSVFRHPEGVTKRALVIVFALLMLIVDGAGVTYKVTNDKIQNQTYIKLDKSRSIPAIHFMAMGVYGEGGYSDKQAIQMAVLPTKKQKTDYSIKKLKRRLKQLGAGGYLMFLIKKQRNNTADGTFGWLKEGHFFRENQKPSNQGLSNKLKNFIYLYGRHIADFRFAAQLWWIVLLGIIALGFGPQRLVIQILRLSMVGGFMFLLLFEGGRSRYLIQYLPCLLLLATFSFERVIINVGRLFGWYEERVDEAAAADKQHESAS
ncbi:TIGR03766 family XrtG-associated glycosyltransferase [Lactiplantibacillus songbeiensis]|uniref:TIGR03766 family XrtG-associated glycosyltransferase n=1 Tax=Lactiplantibacillus songbeiensis TaxID=2559920 RepID=A0ABW4BZ60_9LACO|nr:TIGR03766 family XrtG-associated glycosyltransferase [Lactiplantibacillus songbeiensis]